jgi:CheY-like chemotaxis protein/anti-sigma regulatory factor (Ser/Thr protein kinase)
MELHREAVVVSDLVLATLSTVEPLAERKSIRLESNVENGAQILADVGKCKQILLNLLSNAIKFTPEGGKVTVEAVSNAEAVHLTVKDTGIGIAEADQARIFEEFQQVDGTVSRQYQGTGLGLSLTRRFVELHGGRIWVESEPGAGTCFHILLPRGDEHEAAELIPGPDDAVVASPRVEGGPLVLIVEDDAAAAHLFSVYLGKGGYAVEVVADGRDVLTRARALRPAAITLDVMVPNIDGWQILQALKSDQATRDIPVIVASIIDNEPLGYALGATDYVVKPISRDDLLSKLAKYAPPADRPGDAILVVDDDPVALELVADIVKPLHFQVIECGGGAEAIKLAVEHQPRAILLDLMMPEVSGFDVVAALRLKAETANTPILVITAKDLSAEERNVLNGNVTAVFQKGELRPRQLRDAVSAVVPEAPGGEPSHV